MFFRNNQTYRKSLSIHKIQICHNLLKISLLSKSFSAFWIFPFVKTKNHMSKFWKPSITTLPPVHTSADNTNQFSKCKQSNMENTINKFRKSLYKFLPCSNFLLEPITILAAVISKVTKQITYEQILKNRLMSFRRHLRRATRCQIYSIHTSITNLLSF